jgi:hypothetical protein
MGTMEPITYYADATIRVTSEGIFLRDKMEQRDGRMYTFDAIETLEIHTYDSARNVWKLAVVSLLFTILIIALLFRPIEVPGFVLGFCQSVFFAGILALVATCLSLIYLLYLSLYRDRFKVYVVRLAGRFGYASIAASLNRDDADQIIEAIELARQQRPPLESSQTALISAVREKQYYYADPQVLVASDFVKIKRTQYPIAEIKSAEKRALQVDTVAIFADTVQTMFLLLFGAYLIFGLIFPQIDIPDSPVPMAWVWWVLYFVLMATILSRRRGNVYLLFLRGSFGSVTAHASMNEHYIDTIVRAIFVSQAYHGPAVGRAVRRGA